MAWKHEGSSASARVDQWSLLGHEDRKEEKDKQGHGKGKLSPRHVVQLGAASSTTFVRVVPPLLPHMGGTALGPISAVGGAGGHMKLEPPTKFTGKGLPIIQDWMEEIANWLELSPCTPSQWINIAGTRLEKGASSWFGVEKASIRAGDRAPWEDWGEFAREITAAFSSIKEEEQAWK